MAQRTVKRISPDFHWPVGEVWHGYVNPWPGPEPCFECRTSGLNAMTKKLADTFRSWAPKLTVAEAAHLMEKGVAKQEVQRLRRRAKGSDTPLIRQTLVEFRARRKGYWGQCAACKGEGFVPNTNPAVALLYEGVNLYHEWEPTEPPFGSGWQLWDDTDGYPVSPIFNTPEALAQWCFRRYKKPPVKDWERWVRSFKDLAPPEIRPPFRLQSDHFKVFAPPRTKFVD